MSDQLDVQPHDPEVLDEIEMTSNLMIAASEHDESRRLSQGEIDSILGVPAPRESN